MFSEFKNHLIDYLILLLIFSLGISLFFYFSFDRSIQIYSAILTAVAYFFWGIIHHHLEKNLYFKVVVEYFLIAFLGATVIISLILRA